MNFFDCVTRSIETSSGMIYLTNDNQKFFLFTEQRCRHQSNNKKSWSSEPVRSWSLPKYSNWPSGRAAREPFGFLRLRSGQVAQDKSLGTSRSGLMKCFWRRSVGVNDELAQQELLKRFTHASVKMLS
ncbi:hypothetical protein PCC7424_4346 [Gloeothece citriformis PCC 7424]|uniref:Uncharacterized protein n=1 Tax=Gloeothece citriformis (strain PCC 7424) TaxID=65393 RepID=B7K713_GLOC7|nr:hypothetical protein PCC7424_4346 [Gloeothece citriformis PCC 7424]